MQYQEAVRLGMLHQQLGIPANARVYFEITPNGGYFWDVDSGKTYVVAPPNITPGARAVPPHVKEIIAATDDVLKQRWVSTMGWDDVRETIFSELAFRGINVLQVERDEVERHRRERN